LVNILVVGAGFAGAVYARELAEAGHTVDVIDQRDHIAGNCFDYVHECGVRVHKYGPHLFHTSNQRVIDWLTRFTEWLPYEHKVVAQLHDGRYVPVPVNLDTVNQVFGTNLRTADEVAHYLRSKVIVRDPILNAEDHLYTTLGPELTSLFFQPYTKKMWGMDLSQTDAAVVQRLKVRSDTEDRYFPNDQFQAMPKDGYTRLFERILDHDRINVSLGEPYSHETRSNYAYCFNSMPIDAYFDYEYGELPYRSIRFHLTPSALSEAPKQATINYTHTEAYTRETWWHNIAGLWVTKGAQVLKTVEEPCDYKDNHFERYYPVKSADGHNDRLYALYAERASKDPTISFIGRCGTFQYLDMHQVINQSLVGVGKWLDKGRLDE
jgi:UDP-galactopyranose mutase